MSGYDEHLTQDARLVILRALNDQPDGRLNESIISVVLETFAHRRSREWVRQQLRFLQDMGAVRNTEAGTVLISEITRNGVDHVERRTILEGVKRPSALA